MKTLLLPLTAAVTFAFISPSSAGDVALPPEQFAALSGDGTLAFFSSDKPGRVTRVKIRGLLKGERLLGLDLRPATGQLYALGSRSRLYVIDPNSGRATAVSATPFTPALAGTSFAFDFNPTVDRIRVMSDSGQNLRLHPDTGASAAVDAGLAYAAGDSGFATAPGITACAYTNNDTNPETGTTLYNLDTTRDVLVLQNPPNAGTLNTVGPLGVDASIFSSFDIGGADGRAWASIVPQGKKGPGRTSVLYSINLETGAATSYGTIGLPWRILSLTALRTYTPEVAPEDPEVAP